MKWRSIIVSGLLVFVLTPAVAQQANADTLLALEQRFFYAKDSVQKQNYLLQKCNAYMQTQNVTSTCLQELERINPNQLDTNQQMVLAWNKAICRHVLGQDQAALSALQNYQVLSGDTAVQVQFAKALLLKFVDTVAFQQQVKKLNQYDTLFLALNSYGKLIRYEKKHRNAYILASALLPGSGSIALGYPLKGLTSTAVVGLSVYSILLLSQHNMYLNAIFWGSSFGLKFYAGNLALTGKLFDKRENRQYRKLETTCEQAVSMLLQKYPLDLKVLPVNAQ